MTGTHKTTNSPYDRCVIIGRIFLTASTAEHFDRVKLGGKIFESKNLPFDSY